MYTVWTKPSTASKISYPGITPTEAVTAGLVPVIGGAVIDAAPGMPLAGALRTTLSAASVLALLTIMTRRMKSQNDRKQITRKFKEGTYYLHAEHGNKNDANAQARALRKAKYSVKVTKS